MNVIHKKSNSYCRKEQIKEKVSVCVWDDVRLCISSKRFTKFVCFAEAKPQVVWAVRRMWLEIVGRDRFNGSVTGKHCTVVHVYNERPNQLHVWESSLVSRLHEYLVLQTST